MVHHDVCPDCLSDKISLLLSCNDHFASGMNFSVLSCSDCGFTFTQDYPEESEMGRFYQSENYISHTDTAIGFTNKLYRVVRSFMLDRKKNLIKKITGLKTGKLLDIGSGTGYFAAKMKKNGWQVNGIEINDMARDFSISNFGLDVSTPDNIAALRSETYDCITLWHVLEHFHYPFKYISEISRLLKPGGLCLIALPNSASYDAIHYKQYWAAWDVPRHLWHFNPDTFRSFIEKRGFILESLHTLPLDVFYISQLSEKYKGSKFHFLKGILEASGFALLTVFNKKRSSSIIYILRKPLV